jgi:predicted nucleic acid-binding protein
MELDEGESEAIALALQLKADLLLLDEQQGRIMASRFGLKFVGLLGILIEARNKGLISSVKAVLDDLIAKAGFWVSHKLYKSVPHAAGE